MEYRIVDGIVTYNVNDHIKASGFIHDINGYQFNTLIRFKEKILREKLLDDFSNHDDVTLLKFLRFKTFDLEKTFQMFSECIKWRANENVEEMLYMQFEESSKIKNLYPHGYHQTDKSGRPIYIELLGKVKIKDLFEIADEDRLLKYYIRDYERATYRLHACSRAFGKIIEDGISIFDLEGVSIGVFTGKVKKLFALASKLGQNYYPEMCAKTFLINTSTMFSFLWSLVKGFLNEKSRNKIVVLKSNYKAKLLEYIDANNLPSFFGGNCTCSHMTGGCLFSDIGPWNPEGELIDETK